MRYACLSAALASAPPTPSLLGGGSDSLRLALGLDSTTARPRLPCHQPQVRVVGRLLGGSAGPALCGQIPRLIHGACCCVFKAYVRPSARPWMWSPPVLRTVDADADAPPPGLQPPASQPSIERRGHRAGSTSPAALELCNGFRPGPAYRRLLR
jgi:hypothetical protein